MLRQPGSAPPISALLRCTAPSSHPRFAQQARTALSQPALRPRHRRVVRQQRGTVTASALDDGQPTVYRGETARLVDALLSRQAVKTLLVYLSETCAEAHTFLAAWLAAKGTPPLDAAGGAAAWLSELAAQPLARVEDPVRPSESRAVSPRDVVERVLALRLELAREVALDLRATAATNASVLRAALERTLPPP